MLSSDEIKKVFSDKSHFVMKSNVEEAQFSPPVRPEQKFQWKERIFKDLQTGIGEIRGLGFQVRDRGKVIEGGWRPLSVGDKRS